MAIKTLFPGVALLTGAASGIGRATAVSFATEGCLNIAICDRNRVGLLETSKLMSEANMYTETLIIEVDMLQEEAIEAIVQKTVRKWGRLDYAVNAAGVGGSSTRSTSMGTNEFDLTNGINYRGTWLCGRAELKYMLGQEPLPTRDGRRGNRGSIVHIASQLGVVSRPNAREFSVVWTAQVGMCAGNDEAAYCASKAAMVSMTRSDAIDYSKDNIRINCVCPGVIATPMTQDDGAFAESIEKAVTIAPLNRMGTPQEIADACLF